MYCLRHWFQRFEIEQIHFPLFLWETIVIAKLSASAFKLIEKKYASLNIELIFQLKYMYFSDVDIFSKLPEKNDKRRGNLLKVVSFFIRNSWKKASTVSKQREVNETF